MIESPLLVDMPPHEGRCINAEFACNDNKKPACRHWQGHFSSAKRLEKAKYIGVSAPDDIIIFDVDTDTGITLNTISAALGVEIDWDAAFLQNTPSGGAHYAFTAPASALVAIPNKAGALGLLGFDLRLPMRGYACTGKGYRLNSAFPSLRYALENGNWPRLPDTVANTLAGKASRNTQTAPVAIPERFIAGGTIPSFTIPTEPGTRNAHILPLARWFKGQNPNASHQELFEACAAWHKRALPAIRTKDLSVSLNEFRAAYRLCTTPMAVSFAALIEGYETEHLPRRLTKRCNEAETIAAKIAIRLQRHHGENALFLSCRKLAEVLQCSHVYAARLLKALVTKGILVLSQVGRYGAKMACLASEYFCAIPYKNMNNNILPCVNQPGDHNDETTQENERNARTTVETGTSRVVGTPAQGRTCKREPETLRQAAIRLCIAGGC